MGTRTRYGLIQIHDRTGKLIAVPAIDRPLHTFRYRWAHLRNGATGVTENLFLNYDAFVSCIERWNAERTDYEIID